MALGGIVLYFQFQNSSEIVPIVASGEPYSFEFRVKFPSADNDLMTPTEVSGAIVTLSQGSLGASYLSLWYEKSAATSGTGNIYLTSSAGRLQLTSASLFNDDFYNFSVVRETSTGSMTLRALRYDDGEVVYSTSSVAFTGQTGCPANSDYTRVELGSSTPLASRGQFWGHEFRLWNDALAESELTAHAEHFESYGRKTSHKNDKLALHWRLWDGSAANGSGGIYVDDSSQYGRLGTGSDFTPNVSPFDKSLENYAYIPSYDYGWNQKKVRAFDAAAVPQDETYHDERLVSLEFNLLDALNEDISHLMSSYDELNDFVGLPLNKYRPDYEGLSQMRETYFKRLKGRLNFKLFADMLDYFDRSFVSMVEKILPARSLFKGDEFVVESHMLERPKFQYNARPVVDGQHILSGTIVALERYV